MWESSVVAYGERLHVLDPILLPQLSFWGSCLTL